MADLGQKQKAFGERKVLRMIIHIYADNEPEIMRSQIVWEENIDPVYYIL
jgi:hypothetical protein